MQAGVPICMQSLLCTRGGTDLGTESKLLHQLVDDGAHTLAVPRSSQSLHNLQQQLGLEQQQPQAALMQTG